MADYCEYTIYRATQLDPPEFCENEAVEGTGFCSDHQDEDIWDRADEEYARAKEHYYS